MNRWIKIAAVVALAGVAAIDAADAHVDATLPPPAPRAPAGPEIENVILVTIDGVRWQEIFHGADPVLADRAGLPSKLYRSTATLLPNLQRLFFEGGTVVGDPRLGLGIHASGDHHVSLPGYVEIMTGAVADCADNDCEPKYDETIADEIARAAGEPGAVRVVSSWEKIALAATHDPSKMSVNAGRDEHTDAPAFPGIGQYRPDAVTEVVAVDALMQAHPRLLWVGLGDTDEYGHRDDYRKYLDALRSTDAFVGELAAHLDDLGDYGKHTAIIVTADHGRSANFKDHGNNESSGVWLMARGPGLAKDGSIPTPRRRFLRDVAPTIREMLGLPEKSCPTCGEPLEELFPRRLASNEAR